jgi:hypothetical protein
MSTACSNPERDATAKAPVGSAKGPPPLEPLEAPTVLLGLRGNEEDLRACFGGGGVGARGFVKLRWEVLQDGGVENVEVIGSSVRNEAIEQCVSERVNGMRFGAREEKMVASWTFVHRLPLLPGAEQLVAKRRKAKAKLAKARKRTKKAGSDFDEYEEDVQGLTIEPSSEGAIEPGAIEDVVHTGYRLFAHCYRDGIERDASLGGVVRLRFVIDDVGEVAGVADSGSELPDQRVLDCMAEGIFALEFPAPREGDVKVVYRIVFDSG